MYSSVKTYICYKLKWHIRAPEAQPSGHMVLNLVNVLRTVKNINT